MGDENLGADSGNKKLIWGIVAVVIVGILVGGYYMFSGGNEGSGDVDSNGGDASGDSGASSSGGSSSSSASFSDDGLCSNDKYSTEESDGLIRLDYSSRSSLDSELSQSGNDALEGISDLTCLEYLDFSKLDNKRDVDNLSPLTSLTNLKELDLGWTNVDDLSPLSNLDNLESLNLEFVFVNLGPLEGMTSLKTLNLRGNVNDDLSPLKSLTSLENLNLNFQSSEECDEIISALPNTEITCSDS